jgi:methylated-DNA-protein-cysteine methyltransferase related protein
MSNVKPGPPPPAPAPAAPATFAARVAARVRCVPAGRVTTYGAIAAAAGRPRGARAVGRILARLPDGAEVPWWRVVNVRGEITIPRSGHAAGLQRALLSDEGVRFDGAGRVDMGVFGWRHPVAGDG